MNAEFLLPEMLEVAVPLHVERLRSLTPHERDIARSEASKVLERNAEALLFKQEGKTADAFNATARAIAILSFAPGGVTLFGRHWETA